ncbi:MAG: C40 family peptidase [Bacteroidota bacterium]
MNKTITQIWGFVVMRIFCTVCLLLIVLYSCGSDPANDSTQWTGANQPSQPATDTIKHPLSVITGKTTPDQLIGFARTLTGIPYKYGSTDPRQGFDCSGFITHVFNHFSILVPRSSVDFTHTGREIDLKKAKPGDLILFTGTDSTIRVVGHMGILVTSPKEGLKFIHSTSGKAYGVTETPLNTYYMGRFMKVIRIFGKNDM